LNFVEDLSLMVSKIFFAAVDCSGPMPSPLMSEMLYLANDISLAFRVEHLSEQNLVYCVHHRLHRRDYNILTSLFRGYNVAILILNLDGDHRQRVRASSNRVEHKVSHLDVSYLSGYLLYCLER